MNNDNQLTEKINQLLSDPESIKNILEIASSMGLSQKPGNDNETTDQPDNVNDANSLPDIAAALNNLETRKKDERVELLMSIKPFLGNRKQQKVDGLVKALKAANIISSYKNSDLLSMLGIK